MLRALAFTISLLTVPLTVAAGERVAYFAGGCFWCTEADFEKIDGVSDVISGFMGGVKENPSYEDVAYGRTMHREVVQVPYDDTKVTFQQLLSAFWRMHDPTDGTGSFVDRGRHYGSAVYFTNTDEKRLAEGAIRALNDSGKFDRPIATEVEKAGAFYPAEDFHQDYYKKAGYKYSYYRFRSGRDNFIAKYWLGDDTVYQAVK